MPHRHILAHKGSIGVLRIGGDGVGTAGMTAPLILGWAAVPRTVPHRRYPTGHYNNVLQ